MKRSNLNKEGIQFSFSQLPKDYPYRYTIQYILTEKFGKTERNNMIDRLASAIGISRRGFEFYLYARKDSTTYIMSDQYKAIAADVLGIDVKLITVEQEGPSQKQANK